VRDAIAALMAGRTTLVIAHRLSTVRDADWIVVLDRGQVAEQGTHDDLVARNGLYAQLIRSQLALPGGSPRPSTPSVTGELIAARVLPSVA
jgi:ABC-type multidrug transport system fused ATPase/permease subunit